MTESDHIIVVANGERPPDHLVDEAKEAHLLGVDGGAQWILRWGLVPDRVVGDLDSLDERTRTYTDSYGAPIVQTDDELTRSDLARVVDVLVEEHPKVVTFTGCVGARLDHTLANLASMARLALTGVEVRLVERWGSGMMVAPGHGASLADVAGESATIVPLSGRLDGLRLSGFDAGEAPESLTAPFDALAGVKIVSDPAEVSVDAGAVLVFVPRREVEEGTKGGSMGGNPTFRLGTLERTE